MRFSLVALGLLLALSSREAAAQCGAKRSSCATCHASVTGQWHADHAFADLCVACHGGDPDAKDVAAAHVGLGPPRAQCASCHAAARYEAEPVKPKALAEAPAKHGRPVPNTIASIVAASLAIGGLAYVVRRERKRS